ncbi:MAG: hypothetical protein ABJR05_14505 [Balneola sp.]
MNVRVGLDFGTHQTKVCVNYQKKGQVPVYEFINFGQEQEIILFLPSRVNIHYDGSVSVGNSVEKSITESFRYFKMASAEDQDFRGVSGLNQDQEHYDHKRYGSYTPEVISIIYLAFVIGMVEQRLNDSLSDGDSAVNSGSFMSRFFGGNKSNDEPSVAHTFHYQVGIPTEWSNKANYWRRRKFEQILYLAHQLNETYNFEFLRESSIEELLTFIESEFKDLAENLTANTWESIVKESAISAFPEAAAGLTYLVKTEKIGEGYYLSLDIGGGSTDISFFRVNSNRTFEYLASESLLIASNDVFDSYRVLRGSDYSLEMTQDFLDNNSSYDLANDEEFILACRSTIRRLEKKIKKIYNQRVYHRFKKYVANTKFKDQSCYLYGGGSFLFTDEKGTRKFLEKILLHDQGNMSLTATRTFADVDRITEMSVPDVIKPAQWKKYLPLLIVPLGLSYIQPDQSYSWSDTYYKPGEGYRNIDDHPELFDIYKRRWV